MMTETFNRWISDHGISEVECLVPDMNGVLRGKALLAKDPDKALADFDRALRLKPEFGDAYASRGSVWLKKKDYTRALADLDRAIALEGGEARLAGHAGIGSMAQDGGAHHLGVALRGEDLHESGGKLVEFIRPRNMAVQGGGVELRQNVDAAEARVDAVRDRPAPTRCIPACRNRD